MPLADLVRQSVGSRLAGYEDINDAEGLSQDPVFRLIGSEKVLERGAALTSRLQLFETGVLTQAENLAGLAALNRDLVAKGEAIDSRRRVLPDMDSSTEIAVYEHQEHSVYNGHFESTCYHPLLLFTTKATVWRPSCARATSMVPTVGRTCCCPRFDRQEAQGKEMGLRGDAAFARPEIY